MKVNFNFDSSAPMYARFAFISASFAAALFLSSCGGSKSGDPDASVPDATIDATTPPPDASGLCSGGDGGLDPDGGLTGPIEMDGGASSGNLRQDVNVALATHVVLPTLRDQEKAIAALVCATLHYAEAPTDAAAKAAAQDAWRAAMAVVQRAELLRIGPAGPPSTTLGGLGIADEIYAWPLINRCKIDQILVSKKYEDTATLGAETVNARTLYAMEYLLFPPSNANACGSIDPINAGGTWKAITDLAARRATYAHQAALLAYAQASRLVTAWEPNGGNFLASVTAPGTGGSPFSDAQQVLNGFSDALFYLYSETRDMKVAAPAGINDPNMAGPMPDHVESPFADGSLAHIRENIVGFRILFTGGASASSNLGFDDLLVSLGTDGTALATDMVTKIDAARAACDAVPEPLETSVTDNPAEVQACYDALKAVSDLLKSQFISLLGLQAPMGAAGDND